MSKKKKQKTKQFRGKKLPSKEHYKFDLLLAIFIIYNTLFLIGGIYKNFFKILNPDALYFKIDFSIFLIISAVLNLIILFFVGEFHSFATINNNIPFKNYFRGENKAAKQKAKECFSKCGILILISLLSFLTATQIRIETTESSLIKCNIFSHKVLFNYDDVEKIEVNLNRENMALRTIDYNFTPTIKIYANNNTYELDSNGFGYNYSDIEEFLNKFPENIIIVNNEHTEDVIIASNEQKAAFERIFM